MQNLSINQEDSKQYADVDVIQINNWLSSSQAISKFGLSYDQLIKASNKGLIAKKVNEDNKASKLFLESNIADFCQKNNIKAKQKEEESLLNISFYQGLVKNLENQIEQKDKIILSLSQELSKQNQEILNLLKNQQILQKDLQERILPKLEQKETSKNSFFRRIFGRND
jgi:hypothetical protein